MYLNKGKISRFKVANALIIAVCGISSFGNLIFAIFLIFSVTVEKDSTAIGAILILLLAMSIKIGIIIWRAILVHRLTKCRIYNQLLEEDHDGILAYSSIASMIGRPEANVVKDIKWFAKEKFLIKINVEETAVRVDLAGANEFITVLCPACGSMHNDNF